MLRALTTALCVGMSGYGREPLLVFRRCGEGANHSKIVSCHSVVQYIQPEGFAARVWISAQVAEVLHTYERAVVLSGLELLRVYDLAQHVRARLSARLHVARKLRGQICVRQPCLIHQVVDEIRGRHRVRVLCAEGISANPLIEERSLRRCELATGYHLTPIRRELLVGRSRAIRGFVQTIDE